MILDLKLKALNNSQFVHFQTSSTYSLVTFGRCLLGPAKPTDLIVFAESGAGSGGGPIADPKRIFWDAEIILGRCEPLIGTCCNRFLFSAAIIRSSVWFWATTLAVIALIRTSSASRAASIFVYSRSTFSALSMPVCRCIIWRVLISTARTTESNPFDGSGSKTALSFSSNWNGNLTINKINFDVTRHITRTVSSILLYLTAFLQMQHLLPFAITEIELKSFVFSDKTQTLMVTYRACPGSCSRRCACSWPGRSGHCHRNKNNRHCNESTTITYWTFFFIISLLYLHHSLSNNGLLWSHLIAALRQRL